MTRVILAILAMFLVRRGNWLFRKGRRFVVGEQTGCEHSIGEHAGGENFRG